MWTNPVFADFFTFTKETLIENFFFVQQYNKRMQKFRIWKIMEKTPTAFIPH